MKQLIKTFGDAIVGVSSGFDRLVFQGMIRPLMYPEGAMGFFSRRRILFKDARDYMGSCARGLASAQLPLTVDEVVAMGHHLREYRRMVEENEADLLVMHTKDDDQLAMHGLAYPLAIEVRSIPLLLL